MNKLMKYQILLLSFFVNIIYTQDFSFLGINFEMTQEEIITTIENSKYLIFAEDILLKQLILPTPYTLVLKSSYSNNNLINKVFIDFNNKLSYQITIFFNPEYFSFYTLSEKMLDNYGIPQSRNANKVTWYDTSKIKRATLEFPATVKFTDMSILEKILQQQNKILEKGSSESLDYKERQFILNEL